MVVTLQQINLQIEKLECIIVHGIMHSVPNSASLSLATPRICAILLMLVMARFLVTEMDYLQTFKCNCSTMIGADVHVNLHPIRTNLEEKTRINGGQFSLVLEAILSI